MEISRGFYFTVSESINILRRLYFANTKHKNMKNLKTCYHKPWLTKLKSSHVLLLRLIFSERKTQEKSQILLSKFFPIHFYYLDIFPHFLRGISCRLNFTDRNFLIFWPIIYFRKDQNLQNP